MANLAGVDLNLLVVLDALITEAHVGRAGQKVGLSQPATSHSLSRLRALFGDALLVRSGSTMILTPRALELRGPVAEFLGTARNVLKQELFNPASSRRRFRCMMPDLVFHLLMPPLLRRLQEEAPGIVTEGIAWRGPELLTPAASSQLDFIVTSLPRSIAGFERHPLYEDRDLIAVRANHPNRGSLDSVEGLAAVRHVAIIGAGEYADILDEWLLEVGMRREVAAIAPNYLVALSIAASTDLVAIVPGKFAASMAPALGLDLVDLPLDPGADSLDILSPVRSRSDEATSWMRRCMQEVAAAL
jgi:DNA-binding transcriptional LysR family regulator